MVSTLVETVIEPFSGTVRVIVWCKRAPKGWVAPNGAPRCLADGRWLSSSSCSWLPGRCLVEVHQLVSAWLPRDVVSDAEVGYQAVKRHDRRLAVDYLLSLRVHLNPILRVHYD